jgi:dipeptidyl-peptidase-4
MNFNLTKKTAALCCLSLFLLSAITTNAQGKIKNMPGYYQYQKMASQLNSSVPRLSPNVVWNAEGKTFTYLENDTLQTFDVKKNKVISSEVYKSPPRTPYSRQGRPARGRQYASVTSPDTKLKAFTKDRNVYISNPDGSNVIAITSDGDEENLVKYGIATWVYGEELGQNTAMWWSPDSKKIAFYRFEEKDAEMYYVLYNQTKIQDSL